MTNSPPVVVEGLRVVRGAQEVLPGIDAVLPRGVITGLLGPSGSGKSTFMRAGVGVQVITSGTVTVLGHPAGSAPLRRRVGYSTQSPAVYQDLTVAENLRYFAAVRGDDPADVDRVLALVGLTRYADRVAGRLSGGELGRASLAVALLGKSELLVLDEPTVGLDPVLRGELWDLFHELTGEGVTMLISSHVMDEAARCDELLLMRDGQILAQASPEELIRRTGAKDTEQAFVRLVNERGPQTRTVSTLRQDKEVAHS
jgi:ABC-2 type transport system ATP-binding protein